MAIALFSSSNFQILFVYSFSIVFRIFHDTYKNDAEWGCILYSIFFEWIFQTKMKELLVCVYLECSFLSRWYCCDRYSRKCFFFWRLKKEVHLVPIINLCAKFSVFYWSIQYRNKGQQKRNPHITSKSAQYFDTWFLYTLNTKTSIFYKSIQVLFCIFTIFTLL